MLVPLYGFVEGDTMGLLVLARDDMLLSQVADKLRESARTRVNDTRAAELVVGHRPMKASLTVTEAGLRALDRVDLRFIDGETG